jgi:tRNA 5-methylaminomethyl-2-thiouridine biosynthesis bifunctional protein
LRAHGSLTGAQLADLPRRPGLYCLFALGSRGLALAPLLGEQIAAQIEGEPEPLERPLGAGIDPARYLLRHLRRGTG